MGKAVKTMNYQCWSTGKSLRDQKVAGSNPVTSTRFPCNVYALHGIFLCKFRKVCRRSVGAGWVLGENWVKWVKLFGLLVRMQGAVEDRLDGLRCIFVAPAKRVRVYAQSGAGVGVA